MTKHVFQHVVSPPTKIATIWAIGCGKLCQPQTTRLWILDEEVETENFLNVLIRIWLYLYPLEVKPGNGKTHINEGLKGNII